MPERTAKGRRSQTETAVLGGLSIQPMTGYALREAINDVLGHFWRESFGQIYPTLATLEQQQLVRRLTGPRASSSVFEITPAGRDRLRDLLDEPIEPTTPRNGLLLRLFFGRTLGVERCRELLHETRAAAQASLAEYQRLTQTVAENEAGSPDLPFALVTIAAGRRTAEATIAWVDDALGLLEGVDPAVPTPPISVLRS